MTFDREGNGKTIRDPRQRRLLDPFEGVISQAGWKLMANGWQGVMRHFVLQRLPALRLGDDLSDDMGRPSAELYFLCGLLLIKEFQNWTVPQAHEAVLFRSVLFRSVLFRSDVQYALNDENVRLAASRDVALISPVPGGKAFDADEVTAADFVVREEDHAVLACPAGHVPLSSSYNVSSDCIAVTLSPAQCACCPLLEQCPVRLKNGAAVKQPSAGPTGAGVSGGLPCPVGHRRDEQRLEASVRFAAIAGPRVFRGPGVDSAESDGLEHPAGRCLGQNP